MKFYKGYISGSIEPEVEELQTSFALETKPSPQPRESEGAYSKRLDSFEKRTSVCFFAHSGSVLPEKPALLQETDLSTDRWHGYVVDVENESLVIDIRNDIEPQNRLKLRVKKSIVEGDVGNLNELTSVIVYCKRIRTYQDTIKNEVSVRLREPAVMTDAVLEKDLEAKLARFSYMFTEE